ncbi:MAG: hypothetical protein WAO76_04885 [Georgfuchsia sp.]
MLKKLLYGFIFGLGFSLAVLLVGWMFITYQLSSSDKTKFIVPQEEGMSYEEKAKWSELPLSKKISKLSGAVLLGFKEEDNQFMAAYVDRIYTKDSAVKIPLNIGDRVEKSDYYAKDDHSSNRDGMLLMYVDNPPKEIECAYLYDSRLIAYGDMPLELFVKKFKEAN